MHLVCIIWIRFEVEYLIFAHPYEKHKIFKPI